MIGTDDIRRRRHIINRARAARFRHLRHRAGAFAGARSKLVQSAAAAGFLFVPAAHAVDLRVVIEGVASSSGTIIAGLYEGAEQYENAIKESAKASVNDSNRLVGVSLRAVAGTQSVVFTDLRPSVYSVIIFHDENDDGKLDKNAVGMPTEAYAISNNARGVLSAPQFEDAAIALDQSDKVIKVSLVYPRRLSERP